VKRKEPALDLALGRRGQILLADRIMLDRYDEGMKRHEYLSVGASLLAMDSKAARLFSKHALSLTSIASKLGSYKKLRSLN
jgi:hypothetical protein